VQGSWDYANFGLHYNNNRGANGAFTTTLPNTGMVIQFDEHTGRIRAIEADNVPAVPRTWGDLKAAYR
jgi:hypothetical protein